MPPYAITRNAAIAAANAPIMKRRVLRRMALLAVGSVMVPPGDFTAQPRDDRRAIDRQHDGRHRVGGHDEVPAAGDHSVHTFSPSAGGATNPCFNRIDAMRARNMMKAVIRNRMPNAFTRSGNQN